MQNCCQAVAFKGSCGQNDSCSPYGCASLSEQLEEYDAASSFVLNKKKRYWNALLTCDKPICGPMECCVSLDELADVEHIHTDKVFCKVDHARDDAHRVQLTQGTSPGPGWVEDPAGTWTDNRRIGGVSYWHCPFGRSLLPTVESKKAHVAADAPKTARNWLEADDICCKRVNFCEVEDMLSIMEKESPQQVSKITADIADLERQIKAVGKSARDEIAKANQCQQELLHLHQVVAVAGSSLRIDLPAQETESYMDFTMFFLSMVVGLCFGLVAQFLL